MVIYSNSLVYCSYTSVFYNCSLIYINSNLVNYNCNVTDCNYNLFEKSYILINQNKNPIVYKLVMLNLINNLLCYCNDPVHSLKYDSTGLVCGRKDWTMVKKMKQHQNYIHIITKLDTEFHIHAAPNQRNYFFILGNLFLIAILVISCDSKTP